MLTGQGPAQVAGQHLHGHVVDAGDGDGVVGAGAHHGALALEVDEVHAHLNGLEIFLLVLMLNLVFIR